MWLVQTFPVLADVVRGEGVMVIPVKPSVSSASSTTSSLDGSENDGARDTPQSDNAPTLRPWPEWLVLGADADADVRARCALALSLLDEWQDVSSAVGAEEGEVRG